MKSRGEIAEIRIDQNKESDNQADSSLASIFATISKDRGEASQSLLCFLQSGGRAEEAINAARRQVFLKGNDSHDYKYSSAVLADYYALSPNFRDQYLAASAYLLPGSGDRDNGLVDRVRGAING